MYNNKFISDYNDLDIALAEMIIPTFHKEAMLTEGVWDSIVQASGKFLGKLGIAELVEIPEVKNKLDLDKQTNSGKNYNPLDSFHSTDQIVDIGKMTNMLSDETAEFFNTLFKQTNSGSSVHEFNEIIVYYNKLNDEDKKTFKFFLSAVKSKLAKIVNDHDSVEILIDGYREGLRLYNAFMNHYSDEDFTVSDDMILLLCMLLGVRRVADADYGDTPFIIANKGHVIIGKENGGKIFHRKMIADFSSYKDAFNELSVGVKIFK